MPTSTATVSRRAWYRPFGFRLLILTNTQQIIQAADQLFGRFGTPEQQGEPDFVFRLFKGGVGTSHLGLPSFHLAAGLARRTMGDQADLSVNLVTGEAEGVFSPAVLANLPYFRVHFLELAFFVMLAPRGLMGVHGAALAKNGRAILLRAQSGGGKTTLAYAGARGRFQALAEDVVWLDLERQIWHGTPWSFHLLPDAKSLFPELAHYQPVIQTNGEMKLEVDLETIRPGSTTASAQPGPVILVERLPGGLSRLDAMPLAEAKPLWLAGLAGTETSFPDYDRHIEALLEGNVYRLYFGNDIDAALDLLERLFDKDERGKLPPSR